MKTVNTMILAVLALSLLSAVCRASVSTSDLGWEERMLRKLDKRMTIELENCKLSDAMDQISSISGVNIIISPKVRANNPAVTLKVNDMDAGTCIAWVTRLAGVYAEVIDNAIFIRDKQSEKVSEDEKAGILLLAARMGAEVEVPAPGVPLTDEDRTKIALKIWEKESAPPQDFPGPNLDLGVQNNGFK